MKNASVAALASIAVHALLAAAFLSFVGNEDAAPDVLVSLDLSSVELSFAEKDDDSRTVAPMPPSPPSEPAPRPEARPPETPAAELRPPLPPDPAAPDFKPPEGDVAPMETLPSQPEAAPVQPEAPRQARIDAPPRPKRTIRPNYPDGARQRGEQGEVVLEILVGVDGSVEAVKVVTTSGFGELDAAAVRAVRAARFTPAKSGGENVASSARLALKFRLRD